MNSKVFKLTCKERSHISYCLKIYKSKNKNDGRNRREAESNFLKYLSDCRIGNTPIMIHECDKENWNMMSWIEGKRAHSLQKDDIQKISKFIAESNPENYSFPSTKSITDASEAFKGAKANQLIVERRIKKVIDMSNLDLSEDLSKWLFDTLLPSYRSISKKFDDATRSCKAWRREEVRLILSQSDAGVHNILRTDSEIYFIDFEYAGFDDLARLVCNWVLNPNHLLGTDYENELIKAISKQTTHLGDSWIKRFHDIKKLVAIQWCTIMIGHTLNKKERRDNINAIKEYYKNAIRF